MKSKNTKWIIIALAGFIIWSMMSNSGEEAVLKEAVVDFDGHDCDTSDDCPCWVVNHTSGYTAYGVGVSQCIDCSVEANWDAAGCNTTNYNGPHTSGDHCDTTWCYDTEIVYEWARDSPGQWMKDNTLTLVAAIGIIILMLTWPKGG